MPPNRWDIRAEHLAARAIAKSDAMVDSLRGGSNPPGKRKLSNQEKVRRFLLFARPMETLTQDEAMEAEALWSEMFPSGNRADVAEFALDAERLRLQQVGELGGIPTEVADAAIAQAIQQDLEQSQMVVMPGEVMPGEVMDDGRP